MAAFHLAHGGRTTRGRPTTTAGVTRVLLRDRVSPRLTTSKRKERRREEKKFKNANGGSLLRGQTILVERVSSCREAVEEVRLFFQVQGPEVVEPLTPTSVPFRSDFEEGIRVIDQHCFSLLSTIFFPSFLNISVTRYMLTLLEII